MKQALAPTVKTSLLAGFFLLLVTVSWGQRPVIQGIEQVSGSTGQLILIKGNSFGGDKSKLLVRFGAVQGTIESASDQTLQVRVPNGTTYHHVSVTNVTSRLTGFSPNPFLLSFSGEHPFSAANLETQKDFTADNGIENLCLCDLNNDGRSDVVTAHTGTNTLGLYINTSTAGVVTLSKLVLNTTPAIGTQTLNVKCADLNGDGWQDLVVTESTTLSEKLFVIDNAANTFKVIPLTISGFKMSDVEINDIDLDGRPDLVVTNQAASGPLANTLAVLRNTSVGTTMSFNDAAVILTATGDMVGSTPVLNGTNALAIQDLNGDGKPEIIVSLLVSSVHNNMYVFPNQSTSGTVSFGTVTKYSLDGFSVQNLRVGDLDGDTKPDIAFTTAFSGVLVYRNTSSGSAFSFASPFRILDPPGGTLNGVDFGDLDGDGKTDVVIAHLTNKTLTVLNNNSTPGSLSFTPTVITTTLASKNVRIGDVDADGKPDIVFTGSDLSAPKLSVLRNKACVLPKIDPTATIILCKSGDPYKLTATHAPGAFYDWKRDGTTVACGKELYSYTINPAATANGLHTYSVVIRTEGGASCSAGTCALASETVTVTIQPGDAVSLNASNNGPVCKNSNITLTAGASESGLSYAWTGPNGYTQTTTSDSPPPFVATGVAQAGVYKVLVTKGGCVAGKDSTIVEVIEVPATSFKISGPAAIVSCADDADFTLQLDQAPMAFTYEWFKQGNATAIGVGAVSPLILTETSSNGDYYVVASSTGCGAPVTTPSVKVTITAKPVVNITIPAEACKNEIVTFEDHSTIDPQATPVYKWLFNVGNTLQGSAEKNPKTSYSDEGSKIVQLTIHYGNNACLATSSPATILIKPSPDASIITPGSVFEFCEGETLPLEAFSTSPIQTYKWSTGETTPTIEATAEGAYSVDLTFTGFTCVITKSQTVATRPAPDVIVTGTPERINEGETSQLTASGLDAYQWEPAESLSDATVSNPVAQPIKTTEYTVTGTGSNGCPGSGTFILQVVGEAIVNKLNPHNFFSPNNDGPNEQWVVDEILTYDQCGVVIYDDKGVKVFEAKPYRNDWNGTFNGKPLPDGVYFYIIRCDGEESTPRAGSITLLR
jgi:gliding motility-associated-like protein